MALSISIRVTMRNGLSMPHQERFVTASAIHVEQQGVALCPADFPDVEDFIPMARVVTRGTGQFSQSDS